MEPDFFDTIIIGAGPAGITAAIYAVRKNLKVLVLTKDIGGQAARSGDIENYPGFSVITGVDLAKKFREELANFENNGLWIKEGIEVMDLSGADPNFVVKTSGNQEYHGKTVIIASGRIPKMLGVKGEKELLGKGVATCSTCDTPFYKDKDVAVVGGGNSALDAAFSLQKVARSITIINNTDNLRGDEILLKNVTTSPRVKILNNTEVLEILGEVAVGGVRIKEGSGKEDTLLVSGVFIEVGWIPSTSFDKLTDKNDGGEIEVDEYGASSIPGIYAAGDVNNLWGEQIIIAAGEGSKVALRVAEHISKVPHLTTSNIHEG
ncbi:MAG: FAD-dependent oxidoreductase [Candidatus Daviesbacteria bacterium]|nr:FAD-dependent oxidoreductase [Candidatus Daviesbacteria bacterium]